MKLYVITYEIGSAGGHGEPLLYYTVLASKKAFKTKEEADQFIATQPLTYFAKTTEIELIEE